MPERQPFRVAAVQAAPVFLDRDATLEQACGLAATAASQGARLIVFPEVFVSGYPDWVWSVPPRERAMIDGLYAELVESAVEVPGPATARLGDAARAAGAYLVIGVNERNVEASGTSLFNTLLIFDPAGGLIGRHRKLIPTGGERLMWAPGDGSTLAVHDTPLGRLGGLICWENYMPLARYALYAWGAQIHVAATWDRGEPWLSSMRHIAKEGRLYVISCCQAIRRDDVPDRYEFKRFYPPGREWINAGDSVIVDPDGQVLAGPLHQKQDILYAELDPRRMVGPRWMLDVAGHYARPDVFDFAVRRVPREIVRDAAASDPEPAAAAAAGPRSRRGPAGAASARRAPGSSKARRASAAGALRGGASKPMASRGSPRRAPAATRRRTTRRTTRGTARAPGRG
ncbi:MAG: hypothetical protein A2W00_05980 [Candidatus Eisenbacteria bacterium RBG_16_71_46]|nr:MAG: hypothetical protein A2W00_05980 [Candidatus Eisenbacteria bacterium RBG_16_71_46]